MADEEPIRVVCNGLGRWVPAEWVELLDERDDGTAHVGVCSPNDYFVGEISASTKASRDDWRTDIRVDVQRAIRQEEKSQRQVRAIQDAIGELARKFGNIV
jgi:hypothetical protein